MTRIKRMHFIAIMVALMLTLVIGSFVMNSTSTERLAKAQSTVATPVFTPEGGNYASLQEVTISCETEGASIYFTIDGTDPTTSSDKYMMPIALPNSDGTYTIKAMAVKDGMDNSAVASATYVIGETGGEDPVTLSVVKWEYDKIPDSDKHISASDMEGFAATTAENAMTWVPPATDKAQRITLIYDVCSTPGEEYLSFVTYLSGVNNGYMVLEDITTGQELREFMREYGWTYYYTGKTESQSGGDQTSTVATPVITPDGGEYSKTVSFKITCATNGATIYYSTDGSNPNKYHSIVYEPGSYITVYETTTVRAIAVKDGLDDSAMAVAKFTIGSSGGDFEPVGPGEHEGNVINGHKNAKHGFCVGWVAFIFVMLLLLYTALYIVVWLPQTASFAVKCKLDAFKQQREKVMLFDFIKLLLLIGIAASSAIWIFALVVLIVHTCAVSVVSFVLATLILGFFGFATWCEKKKKDKQNG